MRTLGAAICMVAAAGAFVLPGGMRMSAQPRKAAVTRRDALLAGGLAIAGAVSTAAAPAHAASTIPGGDRLLNGYKQLTYLLDNWDKETTSCDANGALPTISCAIWSDHCSMNEAHERPDDDSMKSAR
eukprot:TRINITY_DN2486_c0_g1_i2.p3 TRINITY_DN2486_c0_g1~~TRINITY_DN2486_c0_g1_i2.p3  ORF type:complete len:128 (+),score=28.01 TRINITY_DN2486_c0_g1_i2:48-431(+)